MNSIGRKRKWSAYDEAFKHKVIEYADANNSCASARELFVNKNKVQEWQ